VYVPSVETAFGVMSAMASALGGKLNDFKATAEAARGPLTERKELAGMSL